MIVHACNWKPQPRSQAISRSILLTAYVTFEPPREAWKPFTSEITLTWIVLKWFYRELLESCYHVHFTAKSSLLLFFFFFCNYCHVPLQPKHLVPYNVGVSANNHQVHEDTEKNRCFQFKVLVGNFKEVVGSSSTT